MIFIQGESVSGAKIRVDFIHYNAKELEQSNPEFYKIGFTVEDIPKAESKEGYFAITFFDPESRKFSFEYNEVPKTQMELLVEGNERLKQEFGELVAENKRLQEENNANQLALMELHTMLLSLLPDAV